MDLSICILTRSQPELLCKCVTSCISEIEQTGISAEIIIIDNASVDRNPQQAALLSPRVRVVRNEENVGFAAGNNQAIRMSRGNYVLLLNDDAVLQEGSLRRMLQSLKSDPRVGAVGPRLLNADGSLQKNFTNRRLPRARAIACEIFGLELVMERNAWSRDLFTHMRGDISGETEHLAGACLLARRQAVAAIGLLDEGFCYWFEDCDLCCRLKRAGWRIAYLREASVTHYGSASLNKLPGTERSRMYFTSMMFYFRKHRNPVGYWLTRIGVALVVLVRGPLVALRRLSRGRWTRKELLDPIQWSLRVARLLLMARLFS